MLRAILIAGGVGCGISMILGALDAWDTHRQNRTIEWFEITPDGPVRRRGPYHEWAAGLDYPHHGAGHRHLDPPDDAPPVVWGRDE
jgi:hypothetical protein